MVTMICSRLNGSSEAPIRAAADTALRCTSGPHGEVVGAKVQ